VPAPVIVLTVLFVVVLASIVTASLARGRVAVYEPGIRGDTITVDARDESRWRFVELRRGSLASPDTSGWDLACRRFHVIVAGGVADLGAVPFDQVDAAPDSGYIATVLGRDTLNPAVARWYRYSMVSHLLESRRRTYVVRTREGRYAKLEFLSYYCPGPAAGCVTFRYAFIRRPPSRPGGARPALP
jgi:hypothetical protein